MWEKDLIHSHLILFSINQIFLVHNWSYFLFVLNGYLCRHTQQCVKGYTWMSMYVCVCRDLKECVCICT